MTEDGSWQQIVLLLILYFLAIYGALSFYEDIAGLIRYHWQRRKRGNSRIP